MATITELTPLNGCRRFKIRARDKEGKQHYTNWSATPGLSAKTIDARLNAAAADFERQVKAGELLTREQAKEKARAEQAALDAIMTVDRYWRDVFMPLKSVSLAEHSRDSFERNYRLHISPAIGDLRLPDVTAAGLIRLLTRFQANHAHSSAVKVYTILNLLFKTAYLTDLIEKNPMDKVSRPQPRKDEGTQNAVEAFTVEELRHILACLSGEPVRWQILIRLLIDTGIRRGEACGLQWQDVDFDACTITIRRTSAYTTARGVYLTTPKNGRTRTVDADPDLVAMLKEYKPADADPDSFVFTACNKPLHPDSPTRYLARFGERYGIANLHPHKLRHSFASVALTDGGADIVSISEILGHADTAVTLRTYSHASQESRKRASAAFRKALSPSSEKENGSFDGSFKEP